MLVLMLALMAQMTTTMVTGLANTIVVHRLGRHGSGCKRLADQTPVHLSGTLATAQSALANWATKLR